MANEVAGRWWAQHGHWPDTDPPQPMPDTHKHYADTGSPLEAAFKTLGYVPVPAPHTEPEPEPEPVETPSPVQWADTKTRARRKES